MSNPVKTYFINFFKKPRANLTVSIAVAVLVVVAGYMVLHLRASGFFVFNEPEQGTLSGNAQIINDTSASGGKGIQFTAPVSTPPPPPTGGSDCRPSTTNCIVHWTPRCPAYPSFPDAGCTGVPAGVTLASYTGCSNGETVITADNTQIIGKTINCDVAVRAKGVLIKNSKINGQIGINEGDPYSFSLVDSEVSTPIVQAAAVGTTHMTILGTNVHGGATSIYCFADCYIEESWTHAQGLPANVDWHLGSILANDNGANDGTNDTPTGRTDLTVIHSTIACDTPSNSVDGGCSGDLNLFGDFGAIRYVTADKNLFVAATTLAYCSYGGSESGKPYPNGAYISYTNNIFQRGSNGKCGGYGPIDSFNPNGTGNVWTNNKWDDGTVLLP